MFATILASTSHPWRCSRPGWMEPWVTWFRTRHPCPWHGVWSWMILRSFSTLTILWFYDKYRALKMNRRIPWCNPIGLNTGWCQHSSPCIINYIGISCKVLVKSTISCFKWNLLWSCSLGRDSPWYSKVQLEICIPTSFFSWKGTNKRNESFESFSLTLSEQANVKLHFLFPPSPAALIKNSQGRVRNFIGAEGQGQESCKKNTCLSVTKVITE